MKKTGLFDYILSAVIIFVGIGIDQLTKFLAVRFLKPIDTEPLISGVLHLTYVENQGAAFGMLADKRWIFIVISAVAIVLFGALLFSGKLPNRLYTVSAAMIISGGIGNMIDRLALGYVVDFIDFRLINFAVFNGADSFVSVGAGMLILALLLDIIAERKNEKQGKKP